ncbi:MAG: LysR family transcriptional regulator [Pseudacidovorax sp.]|nr:LysR family transcriptional regulator [Pseudacidovorax sp.]
MRQAFQDPQLLRAFVYTAREGNVSRAAALLHLTQPAVSLQLKRLAEEAGVELFVRAARGVTLTAEGAALLPRAEKVLMAASDLQQAALGLRAVVRGRLRIGTILDPEFTRLGVFLRELVEVAPHVETELRQAMSGNVRAQVRSRELDMGFYLSTDDEDAHEAAGRPGPVASLALTRFAYRVVAPAGWDVANRDWRALAALPWLATPKQSVHHRLLQGVLGPLGRTPRWVAMVDQEASMLDLLKSGVGLSLVRDSIAIRESHAHGLTLARQVQLPCTLRVVALRRRLSEPVLMSAWGAIKRAWSLS